MDGMEGANNYQAKKCNDFICSVAANAIASGLSFASGGLNRTTALVGQVYEKKFSKSTWPGIQDGTVKNGRGSEKNSISASSSMWF
jgi:hypothetical protein